MATRIEVSVLMAQRLRYRVISKQQSDDGSGGVKHLIVLVPADTQPDDLEPSGQIGIATSLAGADTQVSIGQEIDFTVVP